MPLLDRKTLAVFAHDLEPRIDAETAEDLEERVGGRINAIALNMAMTTGSAEALRELQFRRTLPRLGRDVLRETARRPAVVLAHAAFAALSDHPAAIHARLRAPYAWRVAEVQRRDLVRRERAERAVQHDDDLHRKWVRALYHADLDDPDAFPLTIDASRFSRERIVNVLLAAADRIGAPRSPSSGGPEKPGSSATSSRS